MQTTKSNCSLCNGTGAYRIVEPNTEKRLRPSTKKGAIIVQRPGGRRHELLCPCVKRNGRRVVQNHTENTHLDSSHLN